MRKKWIFHLTFVCDLDHEQTDLGHIHYTSSSYGIHLCKSDMKIKGWMWKLFCSSKEFSQQIFYFTLACDLDLGYTDLIYICDISSGYSGCCTNCYDIEVIPRNHFWIWPWSVTLTLDMLTWVMYKCMCYCGHILSKSPWNLVKFPWI